MTPPTPRAVPKADWAEVNRRFYDPLWERSRLVSPERFNTWPLVTSLIAPGVRRLEVAPGLRPRLPIEATSFVDASAPAVEKLCAAGADARRGDVSCLPFENASFGLVGAFDIVEHVEDDEGALAELARVAAPGARLLLSVPLHDAMRTGFDDLVGHCRRYAPDALEALLSRFGWAIEKSAVYGMQPTSSRLLDFGVRQLVRNPARAIWWYDRVLLPAAARFQKKLALREGLRCPEGVDEVLLVCRRCEG